jgi:hypothetical protein
LLAKEMSNLSSFVEKDPLLVAEVVRLDVDLGGGLPASYPWALCDVRFLAEIGFEERPFLPARGERIASMLPFGIRREGI